MTKKTMCAVLILGGICTALLTGCPSQRSLKEGDILTTKLHVDNELVMQKQLQVVDLRSNAAKKSDEGDPLLVFLPHEPETTHEDAVVPYDVISLEEVRTFVDTVWPGTPEEFYTFLQESELSLLWAIDIFETSGLSPQRTLDIAMILEQAHDGTVAGSELLSLYQTLAAFGLNLADLDAATTSAGYTTEDFLIHLDSIGVTLHSLPAFFEAFIAVRQPATYEEALQSFVALLTSFGDDTEAAEKAWQTLMEEKGVLGTIGTVIKVGKTAYDIIKSSRVVINEDCSTSYLNADDGNWANYTKGTKEEIPFEYEAFDNSFSWLPFADPWRVVHYKGSFLCYYNSHHKTMPGQYMGSLVPNVEIADGNKGYGFESTAAVTACSQVGTIENPVPQGFLDMNTTITFFGISVDGWSDRWTLFGDIGMYYGNHPRQ